MFAGDIRTLHGENVIITKTASSGDKAQSFADVLYKYGAKTHDASIEEHDKVVSLIHSVFQLGLVGIAEVLSDTFDSPKDIKPFMSPNSRHVLNALERVIKQDEKLIADLQLLNAQAPKVRKRFLEVIFRLVFSLENEDQTALLESVKKSKKFFS